MQSSQAPGALLAAVMTPDLSENEMDASFAELTRLCQTLGYVVRGRVFQKKESYRFPTVFGEGKLKEIAFEIFHLDDTVNAIVFDREISPLQSRNVENTINTELTRLGPEKTIQVHDRTAVIIEIFYKHAKSRQARLQIEIAKLKYGSPRLREQLERGGDRQGGGVGGKGAGETKSELKGRELRDKLAELRHELDNLLDENDQRREHRGDVQSTALVGYTNSGKSSLMRSLTTSEIYVADRLFATLDVTTRQLQPPVTPSIVVTDTVGFVRFLPHDLLASFKSTLSEANHADLLLHVIDGSDPQFREHIRTTNSVLKELGADQNPQQLLINKIDKIDPATLENLKIEFPTAWHTSALDPAEVQKIRQRILAYFQNLQMTVRVLVPFSLGRAIGEIRKVATVLQETFRAEGTDLVLSLKPTDLARLRNQATELEYHEISRPS